jgi:hypothetical protein
MEKELFYVKLVGWIFDTKTRKILLGKNKGEEKYSLLEGDLNQDQELDNVLKTTITKKTGYKCHNLGAIYVENKLQDNTKLKVHFLCEIADGELTPGENVEELIWVQPKDVEEKIGVELPTRLQDTLGNLQGTTCGNHCECEDGDCDCE